MNLTRPSSSSSTADAPGLLYAGFNQDYGCFAAGLDGGLRIYNSDPFKEKMRKEFQDGGIAIVEMLFRCNYLALVGGGKNPKYARNKVIIWDDAKDESIAELEFRSEVKNVKLRKDRIVVVLPNKVFVYRFSVKPVRCAQFETGDNDKGLVALSSSPDSAILALLSKTKGHIQIANLDKGHKVTNVSSGRKHRATTSSPLDPRASNDRFASTMNNGFSDANHMESESTTTVVTSLSFIPAHAGKLSCLALNADGSKCASASEKGTLIRVFHASSGRLLNELRRGVERAEIYSIAFSHDAKRLCVSSDRGTVHIFNLEADGAGPTTSAGANADMVLHNPMSSPSLNRHSSLSFMKDLLPKYFSSEWSFAHFKVPDCRCICGFGPDQSNTIIVICADGSHWKFRYDPNKGGECQEGEKRMFLSDCND